ncbi:MAG TPA: ABC transporter ATP-binding protein, partial [Rhizomicrobium sp.]|nr:ABC transporter ATP-binding protein [Rhizomicrobium sp.]
MNRPVLREAGTFPAIRRLLVDYVSGQWGLLLLAIISMLFASAMYVGIPWLVYTVTKQVFMRHQAALLLPLSLMAFGIMVLRAAGLFFGRVLIDSLGEKIVAKAQSDMFGRLIRRDLADLNAVHSGQFVSNFLYDATLMRDAFTQGVAAIFMELVQLVAFLAYVMVSDWQLGLISLLALPAVAWAMERLGGSMRRAATRGMSETGDLSIALSEAMDGRRIIKAYGLEIHSVARVDARLRARLRTLLKAVRLRAAAAPMTDIFAGMVIAFVIFYAGSQILHGELSFPAFTGFMTALLLAQQPVRNLSQLWPTASAGIAAAHRMFAAIDARPSIVDQPGAVTLHVPRNGGAVAFEDVRFGYEGDAAILDGVTFHIPAGSKVALVGPSGAGKTTIFNLILRFYDRDGGHIAIDGQDILDVTLDSLRAAIGVVTQEAVLFDESVHDNIAL